MDTVVNVLIAGALIVACYEATRRLGKRLQRNRTMRVQSAGVLMKLMANRSLLTTTTKQNKSEVCSVCDATPESHYSEKNQQCCCQP